jgi:hypothetical protein
MKNDQIDVNPASERSAQVYEPTPMVRDEHSEDELTRILEHQAAKLPSDLFLFTAISAMLISFGLELAGRARLSRFIGMWPPALLMMGIYNKLVKMMGPR